MTSTGEAEIKVTTQYTYIRGLWQINCFDWYQVLSRWHAPLAQSLSCSTALRGISIVRLSVCRKGESNTSPTVVVGVILIAKVNGELGSIVIKQTTFWQDYPCSTNKVPTSKKTLVSCRPCALTSCKKSMCPREINKGKGFPCQLMVTPPPPIGAIFLQGGVGIGQGLAVTIRGLLVCTTCMHTAASSVN